MCQAGSRGDELSGLKDARQASYQIGALLTEVKLAAGAVKVVRRSEESAVDFPEILPQKPSKFVEIALGKCPAVQTR